jgi:hypothetical protein
MNKAKESLLHGKTSGFRSSMTNANHLFSRIDSDNDGVLTPQELSSYLKKHTSMQKEQIQASLIPFRISQCRVRLSCLNRSMFAMLCLSFSSSTSVSTLVPSPHHCASPSLISL